MLRRLDRANPLKNVSSFFDFLLLSPFFNFSSFPLLIRLFVFDLDLRIRRIRRRHHCITITEKYIINLCALFCIMNLPSPNVSFLKEKIYKKSSIPSFLFPFQLEPPFFYTEERTGLPLLKLKESATYMGL